MLMTDEREISGNSHNQYLEITFLAVLAASNSGKWIREPKLISDVGNRRELDIQRNIIW